MLKTKNFTGVEIFAVGTWNGNKFTAKDLANLVNSYTAEKGTFSVPIKLGHNDKQTLLSDDMPAAGWVENLRIVGDKLVADFMKVPETVANLIESGAFRKRSVEINKNFKIGDNVYPLVLTGLALLGSTLPAVDTLADITKLYSQEQIEAEEDSEAYLFEAAEEESFDDMLASLDEFVNSRVVKHFKGKPGAPVLRTLHRAFREGLQRANKISHNKEFNMKPETLKLLGLEEGADDAAIEAAIEKLGNKAPEQQTQQQSEADKAEFNKLQADFLKLQGELAAGKATVAVDKAITDGKLLPAQRETAMKMALRDLGEFESFIETQPKVVELGERGTQKQDGNFSRFEPTEIEKQAAKSSGIDTNDTWRKGIMLSKARDAGIEIPASYFEGKAS